MVARLFSPLLSFGIHPAKQFPFLPHYGRGVQRAALLGLWMADGGGRGVLLQYGREVEGRN